MNHGIGYQFKIINDRIKARADADLKTHDLTLTQTRVLGFLAESGGQATQKEIEADLQVSHPTVVGIISRHRTAKFLRSLLDNGQAEAGSARFPGPRFIHPIEPLENTFQLIFRDPNTVILHDQHCRTALRIGDQPHLSVLLRILDTILSQIQHQLENVILPGKHIAVFL